MAVSSFREQWRQALPLVGVPRLLRPWLREPGSLTARCLRHCRDFRVRLLRQESAVPLVEMGMEGRRCLPLREVLLECDGRPVVFAHSVLSAPHSGALGRWFAGLGCRSLGSLLFTGLSLAIVFLHNGSTGGTDIIAAIVNKYHNISLGRVLIFVDLLIVGSSFFVFNAKPEFTTIDAVRKVVFGLCTMVIENLVLDYVMNAKRESVQFMIFSKKYQEIANAIGMQMDHGVTILDGHGWYTGNEMKVLCILAKKNESVTIFRIVKIIDPNAFVSQSSVIGVYGEGFDEMKVKIKDKDIKTIKS